MKRSFRPPFDALALALAPTQREASRALDLRSDDALIAFWETRPEELPLKTFVFLVALSEWLARTGRDYADADEMIALRHDFEPIVMRLVRLGLVTRAEWMTECQESPS